MIHFIYLIKREDDGFTCDCVSTSNTTTLCSLIGSGRGILWLHGKQAFETASAIEKSIEKFAGRKRLRLSEKKALCVLKGLRELSEKNPNGIWTVH